MRNLLGLLLPADFSSFYHPEFEERAGGPSEVDKVRTPKDTPRQEQFVSVHLEMAKVLWISMSRGHQLLPRSSPKTPPQPLRAETGAPEPAKSGA